MPKKSHRNSFKFANYPNSLIQKLKTRCRIEKNPVSTHFKEENEIFERKALQLNKLESFLLKTVIPFIRIAHCPRGSYFKVLGDLILISADVTESLEKILPLEQSLIPVSFKRKLAYEGSYIEEFVEKEKVKLYFDWLKLNNHLYSDFQFDNDLLDGFEQKSMEISSELGVTSDHQQKESDHLDESELLQISDMEENDDIFRHHNIDKYQPVQKEGEQDHSSVFLNKYCEDINLPTVCNTLANIVVDFETSRNILIADDEEDLGEYEENEELFLKKVDDELDSQEFEIEENLPSLCQSHESNVQDELESDMDILSKTTLEQDKQ